MNLPINKLFGIFDREIKGVHQAALLLGLTGILTKVLALFRDRLLAGAFGAGPELDIYFAAFRIPDFIFTLTLFMTAGASLIPIFLKEYAKGKENARVFLGGILISFLIFIFILIAIMFAAAPLLVRFVAPGFGENQIPILVILTRIMLLSPLFLGLSNIVSVVIQSFQKFFIYALSPLFYNAGIIFGIMVLFPVYGINGLAWGVALGAFLHFLIQLPSFLKLKMFPRLIYAGYLVSNIYTRQIWTPIIKNAYWLGFLRTIGLSFNQAVLFVLTALASLFSAGSISVFNFANNLQSVPLTVIGLSYSIAAFPVLSRLFVNNHREDFLAYVSLAIRHIIFWSLPVSALFIVLRAQIVRSVLGAGAFGWADTRLTAAGLAIFSVSITAQSLVLLLSRAYYAAGKTLKPILINISSSCFIILISFVLIWLLKNWEIFRIFSASALRVADIADIKILALIAAFSLGFIMNAVFLASSFIKDFGLSDELVIRSLRQNIFSSLGVGVAAYFGLRIFSRVFDNTIFLGIFFQGFSAGILGLTAGFLILFFLKNKELNDIMASLRTKFWKTPVIAEGDRL